MCLTLDWFWEQEGIKVQKIDLGGSTLPSSEIWGTAKKRYYERLSTQIRQYTLCTTQSGKQMPRKWTSWSKTFSIYRVMCCGDTVNKVVGENTSQLGNELPFRHL